MVTIENNEVRLNSRMEELSFSKTNYDAIVTQKGLLAVAKNNEQGNLDFNFSDWTFDDIKSFNIEGQKNPIVFYCGKNPLSNKAQTLLECSKGKDFLKVGYALVSLLTQAALNKVPVPLIGAGGILVDTTENEISFLFMPEDLFKYSAAGLPEAQYSELHAHWLNSTLYDLPALCFMRGVIAYKMVTGKMPYTAVNQLERNADFLDSKFLPVEYCCKNLDKELERNINKALKLNANIVNIPGKKKKGKASEDLTPTAEFPLEALFSFTQHPQDSAMSEEEIAEKNAAYLKKQEAQISLKRKIRRNKTAIIVSVIAVIGVIIVIRSTIKSNLENYTSKGLTSVETIEGYFKAVNQKDSVTLDIFTKGGNTNGYNDAVSNIFVVGKMQQQYTGGKGFLSPGKWAVEAENNASFDRLSVYGVTGLEIDGTPVEINPDIAQKLDNPPAITYDNNKAVANGDVVQHKLKYYLLYTDGEENEISVTIREGSVELTFVKDRWRISNFNLTETPVAYEYQNFVVQMINALTQSGNKIEPVLETLRTEYPWLPDAVDVEVARYEIEDENAFINSLTSPAMPLEQ